MLRVRKPALECCKTELAKLGIGAPNDEALAAIIEADIDFTVILNRYRKAKGNTGLDTFERHILFDLIGDHFVNRTWPVNGDGLEKSKAFVHELITKAAMSGWTFGDELRQYTCYS